MPIPKPTPKQTKQDFIASCMASNIMNKEFPKQEQRYAVCNRQWEIRKKKKQSKGNDKDPIWSEVENDGFLTILTIL